MADRKCTCNADAYSLNPAEVVVHRADGPCYWHRIDALSSILTAGVNDGMGSSIPDGADDAPDESKGESAAAHPAAAIGRPAPAVDPMKNWIEPCPRRQCRGRLSHSWTVHWFGWWLR